MNTSGQDKHYHANNSTKSNGIHRLLALLRLIQVLYARNNIFIVYLYMGIFNVDHILHC